MNFKTIKNTTAGLGILVVAVVCLNIIAEKLYFRVDTTSEKVFSLSQGTRKILGSMEKDVTAKLYFSRSIKDLPVIVKTYATRVEEVLGEYRAHSGGRLTVEVIDPKPDTDDEEWAQKYGLSAVRLPKGDQMFFGIVFIAGSQESAIPYLDPRREEFLEYDLSAAMVAVFRKDKPKIGIMSSLSVDGGGPAAMMQGDAEPWVLVNELRQSFQVESVAASAPVISPDLKALLVIHPKSLPEATQYAIDQYVLGGGRLILAVDPMSRVDMQEAGMAARSMGQMPQVSSDLNKLLTQWDIQYDPANMVGDVGLATQINAGGVVVAYPFFMSMQNDALSRENVITADLKQMMIAESGAISLKDGSAFKLEPLIRTTKESGTGASQMAAFMMPQDLARELKPDGKERIIAGIVRGKFKSAFPGGAPAVTGSDDKAPQEQPPGPHLSEAKEEATVLVVADTDFMADQNAADKFRFGSQTMVRMRNDNLHFILNAVDVLAGSQDLISIRSRGRIARPFDRVSELQKQAQLRWQSEEEKLTSELNDLQKKLNELQAQRTDGNQFSLSREQQAEISRFRDEERRVRARRREVRKNLREDIEALGRKLTAANMLVVPLLTSVWGITAYMRRSRRRTRGGNHG